MDRDHACDPDPPACAFCGEPERLSIHDIWTDSNFVLETCCPALLESVSAEMDADPAWGRELLRRLGAEELTGHRLRRVGDGAGCHPMLDWQLVLRPIRFAEARAFIWPNAAPGSRPSWASSGTRARAWQWSTRA